MQYYAHHIGDFIKDTSNLDDHHLATYLRMIWKYYLDESPLPDSCEDLAFALRSDEKTVQTLLKHFFFMKDGAWVHARCEKVIKDFYDKSDKARASAKSRWNKKNMQTQSERIANASKNNANASKSDADYMLPITNNPKPIINTDAATSSPKSIKQKKQKTLIPDTFEVSERVKKWSIEKGFGSLDRHLENFIGSCKAKGYSYVDWDEGFMNAIRNNWAKVKNDGVTDSRFAGAI